MKKRILMLMLAIVIFAAGCGNKAAKEPQVYQTTVESDKKADTETNADMRDEKNSVTENTDWENEGTETLSFTVLEDQEFCYASGAGGWRTILQVEADGSFSGVYSDSDMGSSGKDYPNGTYYYCDFRGSFSEPVKVNDYTYSMKVKDIRCTNEPETTEIIDGILYHYTTPYGIAGAEEIVLFLPGAPIAELPEEYIRWVRNDIGPDASKLPFYGLYNMAEQTVFSSYDVSGRLDNYITLVREQSYLILASLEHDTLTQVNMNIKSQELYELWDDALNYLWDEVKRNTTEEEFEKLLTEQRTWIAEKEKAVEEAGKEVEGGSIYALVINREAAKITEERVYELYELLK